MLQAKGVFTSSRQKWTELSDNTMWIGLNSTAFSGRFYDISVARRLRGSGQIGVCFEVGGRRASVMRACDWLTCSGSAGRQKENTLATVWEAAEILFFCPINNARFRRFSVGQILRHLHTTTSISEAVETFGTEFWKFYRKRSFKNAIIAHKISRPCDFRPS